MKKPKELKMSSQNGTDYMAKPFLSGEEICKIIGVCSKNGVSEFTYDTLYFTFGSKSAPCPAPQVSIPENIILEQQKIEEKTALLQEEIKTKEEQVAELMVADPYLAEKLMAEGELEVDSAGETDGTDSE